METSIRSNCRFWSEKLEPLWHGKKQAVPIHYGVKGSHVFLALLNILHLWDTRFYHPTDECMHHKFTTSPKSTAWENDASLADMAASSFLTGSWCGDMHVECMHTGNLLLNFNTSSTTQSISLNLIITKTVLSQAFFTLLFEGHFSFCFQ